MKQLRSKMDFKLLVIILSCIIIVAAAVTVISTSMIKSVFLQLYEEKLQAPGRIFLTQYSYKDIMPYIENLKAEPEMAAKSTEYIEDRVYIYETEQLHSDGDYPPEYQAAKIRMAIYRNQVSRLKDDHYYTIYKQILDLRVSTGLKYFRILADLDIPGTYFHIFDATFQGDVTNFDGGDLGTPNTISKFHSASNSFRSGKPSMVIDTGNKSDEIYYYYMPVMDDNMNTVAVIETAINMQSLNSKLRYFLFYSGAAIIGISVLIMAVLYFALSRLIIRPVKQLTKISESIASGDLSLEIPAWVNKRTDEIGILGRSYESMQSVLQEMVSANNTLFEAAMSGKLYIRSDLTLFKGFFAQVLSKINETLDVIGAYFDSIPGSIAILNPEYDIVFFNRQFKKMFSEVDNRLIYQKLLEEQEDTPYDCLKKKLEAALNQGEYSALVWFDLGAETKCLSFMCSRVTQAGNVNGAVIVVLDSTELILAKDRALAASKAKSEFLSRVSHELRTPLNVILGMSKLGLNDKQLDESRGRFKKIVTASSHLSNIINDVLEMSRMESGKTEIRLSPMNLSKVAWECIDLFIVKADEQETSLSFKLSPDIPELLISDEFRIHQILINLLSNAVKFTEQGHVTLEISIVKQIDKILTIMFKVSDTGIGMSEEFLTKVFKPFEQEDVFLNRRFEGSGLGLSICYNLVALMDGNISVTSKLGEGSCFTCMLPFEICEDPEREEDSLNDERENVSMAGKRILLVDDIEVNRMIVREVLSETGITLDEAEDGEEALQKFDGAPTGYYDAILMDIQMPKMDGYETTKAIRKTDRADNKLPIIAMTANALKEDIVTALESGMNDHIAKPIDFDICLQKLKQYLQ